MDVETLLRQAVRQGIVTQRDPERGRVRVRFEEAGLTSGWLTVVQREGAELRLTEDGGHSAGQTVIPEHDHGGSTAGRWMPRLDERVLCLYLPVWNGDGFVLGVIG